MIYSLIHRLWDAKEGGERYRTYRLLNKLAYATPEAIKAHQAKQLTCILKAAIKTPYYQTVIARHNIKIDLTQPFETLAQFPVLTKQDIRTAGTELLNPDIAATDRRFAKTGGSTGVSLELVFDDICQKKRNGAQMFADHLAGWNPGMMVAAIWGNPPIAKTRKQRLRRSLLERVIYLDTMNINAQSVMQFVQEWNTAQPQVIFGHAHSIYLLAKQLRSYPPHTLKPRGIVATSMMLLQHERDTIESVFGCKVTNRYGCEEVGLIAVECERHHGMHINTPHIICEAVNDLGEPVGDNQAGKLLLTDLNNLAMPLLRYRVEDVGVLSSSNCSCGRTLPLLASLEGRVADFLKKSDGSLVAGVSLVERTLTNIRGIEQMQLVQTALNHIQVNRVKGADFQPQSDAQLTKELQDVFGQNVMIDIVSVEKIAQEASGKYRFSLCKI